MKVFNVIVKTGGSLLEERNLIARNKKHLMSYFAVEDEIIKVTDITDEYSVDIDETIIALRESDFVFAEIQLKLIENALRESSKKYNFI